MLFRSAAEAGLDVSKLEAEVGLDVSKLGAEPGVVFAGLAEAARPGFVSTTQESTAS